MSHFAPEVAKVAPNPKIAKNGGVCEPIASLH